MRLGVIGLGKLGLPLACVLTSNPKNEVSGLDINQDYVWRLIKNNYQTSEPNCDYSKVFFTSSFEFFVEKTDIAYLCVNTPENSEEGMDYSQVISACKSLQDALKGREYHLIVCSTVLPGTCEEIVQPIFGSNVHIYSSPVWIAMGSVVKDLKDPAMLVVGYDRSEAPSEAIQAWLSVSDPSKERIVTTNTRTAEFIKLAHNAWSCTKMSFMGYLKDNAEKLNIDISDVSNFFRSGGERPGVFWRPGPSFSGPCFPRDLRFWNSITHHPITQDTELINENRILQTVADIPDYSEVLILGSGYKYGVSITEESLSTKLKEAFNKYHPNTKILISDGGWNPIEFKPTHCIVTHKELEPYAPKLCEVLKLW